MQSDPDTTDQMIALTHQGLALLEDLAATDAVIGEEHTS